MFYYEERNPIDIETLFSFDFSSMWTLFMLQCCTVYGAPLLLYELNFPAALVCLPSKPAVLSDVFLSKDTIDSGTL